MEFEWAEGGEGGRSLAAESKGTAVMKAGDKKEEGRTRPKARMREALRSWSRVEARESRHVLKTDRHCLWQPSWTTTVPSSTVPSSTAPFHRPVRDISYSQTSTTVFLLPQITRPFNITLMRNPYPPPMSSVSLRVEYCIYHSFPFSGQ